MAQSVFASTYDHEQRAPALQGCDEHSEGLGAKQRHDRLAMIFKDQALSGPSGFPQMGAPDAAEQVPEEAWAGVQHDLQILQR